MTRPASAHVAGQDPCRSGAWQFWVHALNGPSPALASWRGMDDNRTNAPESRPSGLAKLIGYGVLIILIISIILLATGVWKFGGGAPIGSA